MLVARVPSVQSQCYALAAIHLLPRLAVELVVVVQLHPVNVFMAT